MRDNELMASCVHMLYSMATRRGCTPDEADDLVQDVLLAALEQGRELGDPGFPAWSSGVIRRRVLFVARTAGRRRRREADFAAGSAPSLPGERRLPREFVESLPPSLQTIALLVNAGLGRAEIASLLRISDTALRQRISGLRRAWKGAGMAPEVVESAIRRSSNGPRRRALKASLTRVPDGRLAVADPDGHPIFLSASPHRSRGHGN